MQFQAKKVDLDLELTFFDNEVHKFVITKQISGKEAAAIAEKIINDDEAWSKEKRAPIESIRYVDKQLCDLYEQPIGTFSDNLDVVTIGEIKRYILETLSGIQKRGDK